MITSLEKQPLWEPWFYSSYFIYSHPKYFNHTVWGKKNVWPCCTVIPDEFISSIRVALDSFQADWVRSLSKRHTQVKKCIAVELKGVLTSFLSFLYIKRGVSQYNYGLLLVLFNKNKSLFRTMWDTFPMHLTLKNSRFYSTSTLIQLYIFSPTLLSII